ncbi:hypothetical protein MPH_08164 [Macrophomina phaseolina MS6]|uniref:Uncharacterized protein n=1 Tax=Macrophomina phaseolina (strain MS6) TaxID=1126212 RepID=K2QXR5_MACPH|nr:hypothetical protein MPH_08164 [Macrophomina phaseolina MS6]
MMRSKETANLDYDMIRRHTDSRGDDGAPSPINSSTFQQLRSRRGLPPLKVAIPHVTVISTSTSATNHNNSNNNNNNNNNARRYHFESDLSPDAQQSFNVSQALDAITRCLDRIDEL